ncbi:MAG: hypothetical protein ABR962_05930 [Candidatus Bathyarchaeia archaeon]
MKCLAFFLLVTFLIFPILRCNGQSSGLKITHQQYQWTDDMNRLGITTPELGLTFKIMIWNQGTEPLTEQYTLWITVQVDSTTTSGVYFFKQLQIDYLYLPPNESLTRFVKVDFGGGQLIGSYEAKLTYSFGSSPSVGQPIEEYPFDFRILGNDTFQQEIEQNKGGVAFVFPFNPEIILGVVVGISVLVGAIYLLRKRSKKNEKTKKGKSENKPVNLSPNGHGKEEKVYPQGYAYYAYKDILGILKRAEKEVIIADNYANEELINLYLEKIPNKVRIRVLTKEPRDNFMAVAKKFRIKPTVDFEVRKSTEWHDRWLFVDNECWVTGQSVKDAGTKPTYLVKLDAYDLLKKAFDEVWNKASPII